MAKREVEEKEIIFTVNPRLVSVDGPDGVGKGAFCKVLQQVLSEQLGEKNVTLTSGTRFEACEGGKKIGERLSKLEDPVEKNRLFLFSTQSIYREVVIPFLSKGGTVILDSSTYRHLAYTLCSCGPESPVYLDTLSLVCSGVLDNGILPGVRIELHSSNEGLLKNLRGRGFTDHGDPVNLEQVQNRVAAYLQVRRVIENLSGSDTTVWLDLENPPLEEEKVVEGLKELISCCVLPRLFELWDNSRSRGNF